MYYLRVMGAVDILVLALFKNWCLLGPGISVVKVIVM